MKTQVAGASKQKRHVKVPCSQSRQKFKALLGSLYKLLEQQYPEVLKKIESLQPFDTRKQDTWWEKVHKLSVEGKHVGVDLIDREQQFKDSANSIEQAYTIHYGSEKIPILSVLDEAIKEIRGLIELQFQIAKNNDKS